MDQLPQRIPLFVLDGAVLLPGATARLDAGEDGARFARGQLASGDRLVAVALSSDDDELGVRSTAALARLEQVEDDGGVVVFATGRVRITGIDEGEPLPRAAVELLQPAPAAGAEVEALALEARRLAREIFQLLPALPEGARRSLRAARDPGQLADLLAQQVAASAGEKQRALEALDVGERLKIVVALLARRREVLLAAHDIEGAVQKQVGDAERQHLLRRRLAAIEAELGEGAPEEKDALAEKLSALALPAEVRARVDRELARLAKLPPQSPERSISSDWLRNIAELPWTAATVDTLDVDAARQQLDADHEGLEKVKKRILQFLAVRRLRGDLKGPLLCLAGPPGVGKTSLGQSVARALGRRFVRLSLGGVRDEAQIRGHRRTYAGAQPGRLVQALQRAGSKNPVVMLDEVDKLAGSGPGDPAAALLEVLDPEQNHAFVDHYLEVPLDLSQVLFIATANALDRIPHALRDRLEVLEIPSYTLAEKKAIARGHLLPKERAAHGLAAEDVQLTDAALFRVIERHTREAGVRALSRRLAEVCRAAAVDRVSGRGPGRVIDGDEVEELLGPDRFEPALRETHAQPGIAAGLAWTPVGGEVLVVEALSMPGRGKLILSGQLGEVMQESARAALSYVQSHARELGVAAGFLRDRDVHVHVPAGGTPKDGPSAGLTMFAALLSLFTGVPLRADTAMTGEVSLRGRVLPVGGIREKLLAAHRAGFKRVVLPRSSAAALRELPEEVRKGLEAVLVDRLDEAAGAVLAQGPDAARLAA